MKFHFCHDEAWGRPEPRRRRCESLTLRALLLLLLAPLATTIRADDTPVADFFNVLAPTGADPFVIRHTDGFYYAAASTGSELTLIRSRALSTLGAGERKTVWTPPATGPASKHLWAPEIHRLRGRWYIHFAADDGDNANHRMYVLENPSDDPFRGRFTPKGKLADPALDRWAIDGTVLPLGDRLYFLWSGWEGTEDVRQDLFIAPMRDPWTLSGPRVAIARPTFDWETRGAPPAVNEGPQALVRDGRVLVAFSASGSWTDHYNLGLLWARADADLLDPKSWTKLPDPVFASTDKVLAPGHGSFVASPDGREDWHVYHAARHPGAGWSRLIRAQPFTWGADGFPIFGAPADPDRPIALPSGEPPRRRHEAESARIEPPCRVEQAPNASAGAAVALVAGRSGQPPSSLTFEVHADRAGEHILAIRFDTADRQRDRGGRSSSAPHRLAVNDGLPRPVAFPGNGPGLWSNAFARVTLNEGVNRLRFLPGDRATRIDAIDVVPEIP
jgi:GH43 family beta-xylosidase